MLQQIRDRITGKLALVILAFIALPFVFFGINYNFIGLGFAAKVDGEEISVLQFENAYRNQILSLAEQGQEVPEELRVA
ncbi:MAG: SurA N-terminal domain-containing protein [Pseudomonadota bacterium]